ncbi:uncharacterized protein BXZ73DRAFT_108069 [Epithele typhae]|uniref:uncharacterized protein n=1 Tax=Epithele typhae TaxID=378194 RepID=UPI0020089D2C|nr:uncharacterized protein BXZ73DRAFT_108069 [Epithele typhae]KAH9911335.1 hypothetical protein BXZ73DRAFT_108069 [Epithele typhae]
MQFKFFVALACLASAAAAVPQSASDEFDPSTATISLSSGVTTETFTASQVFQSLMEVEPFVTVIETTTVWTATRTVTVAVPTGSP